VPGKVRIAAVWVVSLLALGVFAAPALADLPVYTTVVNDTDYPISLQATGDESCWNYDDFSDSDITAANSSFTYYSSIRDNNDNCVSAPGAPNAHAYIALYVQQPDGSYSNPFSASQGNMLTTGPDNSSIGNFELFYHNTENHYVYPYNSPGTDQWTPASPTLSGSTGSGMFCLSWTQSYYTGSPYDLKLYIEDEQDCPSTSDGPPSSSYKAQAASAAPTASAAQSTTGGVFNLLPMLQGGCDLFDLSSYCSNISDDSYWTLTNIDTDIIDFEATDAPPTTYAWGALDPPYQEQDNTTNETGTLNYTFDYTEGEDDTSTTTNGYAIGDTITYGSKSGPVNDQVDATYDFSSSDSQETNTQSETSVSSSITTQRDATTYLYGFQGTGTQEFNYTANLTFGDQSGNSESFITPATAILGYSPGSTHPCIGYLVGDSSVSGSAMQMYAQAESLGYQSTDPNFNAYEQAFLSGGAGFNVASSDCPGFSSDFPSGAGFDGSGSMDASVLGGTGVTNTAWYPDLGSIVTCAYTDTPDTDPSNPDTPCSDSTTSSYRAQGASGASSQVPGEVLRSKGHKPGSRLVAGKRSTLLIGRAGDHATLVTGRGAFNVIQGKPGGETLIARGRTDVVYGGSGPDRIEGGPGYDSIYGARGNDRISAGPGTGSVRAGPGNDRIVSGRRGRSGLFGDSGDDTLTIRGTPRIGVHGGNGNDTFRVFGSHATKSIVELAHRGRDTLITDHSFAVPQNIEIARSSGPGIRLTGTWSTQRMEGNRGNDTLVAGRGNERLFGHAGNDALQLTNAGFDTATGGSGADRFIPTAVPFSSWRSKVPKRPVTQVITDFSTSQRDRIVLRAKYFGNALLSHRLGFVQKANPKPSNNSPTLLFDSDSKVLSYDPDGRGAESPRLIARLPNFTCASKKTCLPAGGLQVEK
jgi:Ca2+-binding RTX toxin-like protein